MDAEKISKYVQTGNTKKAVNLLLEYSEKHPDIREDAIILAARYKRWTHSTQIINDRDPVEINKINLAILGLINTEEAEPEKTDGEIPSPASSPRLAYLIAGIAILLSLGVLAFFQLSSDPEKPAPEFTLTVFVRGGAGASDVPQYENARVFVGDRDLGVQQISSTGKLVYENIPAKHLADTVVLELISSSYVIRHQSAFTPAQSKRIMFTVEPTQVRMKGTVYDPNNQPVAGAILDFDSGLARDTTDEFGNFSLLIPKGEGTQIKVRISYNGIEKYVMNNTLSDKLNYSFQLKD